MRSSLLLVGAAALSIGLGASCGSKASAPESPASAAASPSADDDDMGMVNSMSMADQSMVYADLEVGADWQSYTKLNRIPAKSKTHGGRFVDTWVNAVGVSAYKDDNAEIPVGTVIVKTSWEAVDGAPSTVAGPIFVMEKRAPGYDEEHNDWYYAIHWAEPPAKWRERLGGPIYWRSPSTKVAYCFDCHESYDRELGGVPEALRNW